jgi:hypothetical protein
MSEMIPQSVKLGVAVALLFSGPAVTVGYLLGEL